LRPQILQCCPNSCEANTGTKSESLKCSYCGTARYYKGSIRPRKEWVYFPLVRRLKRQFESEKARQLTTYRAQFDGAKADNQRDIREVFEH
ncbi:hypothetical protein BKA61DRAFT_481458, partial [Leptodontidium sp. MPI-SDFR-AT-0119]